MPTNSAFSMVVLSMYVIGNRTAKRDEFCPRRNRQKPPIRQGKFNDLGKRYPCLTRQQSRLPVKGNEVIKRLGAKQ